MKAIKHVNRIKLKYIYIVALYFPKEMCVDQSHLRPQNWKLSHHIVDFLRKNAPVLHIKVCLQVCWSTTASCISFFVVPEGVNGVIF